MALVVALLAIARLAGVSPAELGLRGERAPAALALGALLGLAGAAIGLLVLRYQPVAPGPIGYAPAAGVTSDALALHLVLFLPLGVALPEELAFRGVLLAGFARRTSLPRAVAASSLAFALWHATIVLPTIRETNLAGDPLLVALAVAAAPAVLFAGGIALAILRLRAGTLAASFAAHWAFNAVMLVGLRALS
ncbi:MAG: hypothetical protein AUH85_09245 [Chloroflexi bacterium 13_1_40CM_4_68_4]|nr:MAG: hypothetical protein AUH85_09245 [Chloroflexi bacterium 13_1_40CM_4_68_4]